jgi:NapC/NirT cytochrome c family protein
MAKEQSSLFENWISLFGGIIAGCALVAVLMLFAVDFIMGFENPYMGILTYIVAPTFLILGITLIVIGAIRERSRRRQMAPGTIPKHPRLDFNIPKHRNTFFMVAALTIVFLILTAVGSYQTYQVTESVGFCGQTCHTVMKPEFTAYQNSPHARVACVQCHIGPGAGWFVKSKLSGMYQVYSVIANKYPRPIPTPVHNLRPAQETCEQCHWPRKFFGSAERINVHYLPDEQNTKWTIRLLMKVGGGDSANGPVGGIHWHMNISNKVEYIAIDESRLTIPWVRVTSANGKVTIFQSKDKPLKPEQVAAATRRRMDCIDCHNRPSHIYNAPMRAVNVAMSTNRIDPSLPSIKANAVTVLSAEYKTTDEALSKIKETLMKDYKDYPDQAKVTHAVAETQKLYSQNFFPEMKADWRAYPNHIGHTVFLGCFRCHDGQHVDDKGTAISKDCNSCHTIIAQGKGDQLKTVSAEGLEFEHPEDIGDAWKDMACTECHTGGTP